MIIVLQCVLSVEAGLKKGVINLTEQALIGDPINCLSGKLRQEANGFRLWVYSG